MAIASQCDRCGAFYRENKCLSVSGHYITRVGLGSWNNHSFLTSYDLCDDCIKDFKDFMNYMHPTHTKNIDAVWLKNKINHLGISQREFAKHLGITEPRLSRWVNGKTEIPKDMMPIISRRVKVLEVKQERDNKLS